MTRLEEIEAREQATTKGPWVMSRDEMTAAFGQHRYVVAGTATDDRQKLKDWRLLVEGMHGADSVHDAEFIAHAREDIPWLVARVKELEAALQAVWKADTLWWKEDGTFTCPEAEAVVPVVHAALDGVALG